MKPAKTEPAPGHREGASPCPSRAADKPGVDPVLTRLDFIFRQFGDEADDAFFRTVVTAYRTQAPS